MRAALARRQYSLELSDRLDSAIAWTPECLGTTNASETPLCIFGLKLRIFGLTLFIFELTLPNLD
jgi:hypothetical protein